MCCIPSLNSPRNITNNVTEPKLYKNICQIKTDINSTMFQFHRNILDLESDIYTQILGLRYHLCQLEMIIENQVSKHINTKNEEQISELCWTQWIIETERYEPFHALRQNIKNFKKTFHSNMLKTLQNLQQLLPKEKLVKQKRNHKFLSKAKSDITQLNFVVDEHLLGLSNDIKRLESISDEQLPEPLHDFISLKLKIETSLSDFQNFFSSEICLFHPELQQTIKLDMHNSWPIFRHHVQYLEMTFTRNMFGLCKDIHDLRSLILEDLSLLQQHTRSLQIDICGDFSYPYSVFLLRK